MKRADEPQFDRENDRMGRMGAASDTRAARRGMRITAHQLRSAMTGGGASAGYPQRVMVKVHVPRHHSSARGRDSLRRHVSYLARTNAALVPGRPQFYGAKQSDLDPRQAVASWATDRHHFRIVIAPERAADIADVSAFTREVMRRVEGDLDTRIEWIGVNHFDTGHPHAHVLLRGRADDGTDLVIARNYISHGIRARAEDVATELLGQRSIDHARAANRASVTAERWTQLDRVLERFGTATETGWRVTPTTLKLSRYGPIEPGMLVERLRFLSAHGLAQEVTRRPRGARRQPAVWEVPRDAKTRLQQLSVRNDVIKQLYAAVGRENAATIVPRIVRWAPKVDGIKTPLLSGVLVAKGAVDELGDARFLLVRTLKGQHAYVRVWPSQEYDLATPGGIVELGRRVGRQARSAEAILRVAAGDEKSLYSLARHRRVIEREQPGRDVASTERRLRKFSRRIEQFAQRRDSGVTKTANAYHVDGPRLRAFVERGAGWPDIGLVSVMPLSSQARAMAFTWLDRQIMAFSAGQRTSPLTRDPLAAAALRERLLWIVDQGWATTGDRGLMTFNPGAPQAMRARELAEFEKGGKHTDGRGVQVVRAGQTVVGRYRGLAPLHAGLFALIETDKRLFAFETPRAPWAERGERVHAARFDTGRVRIERAPERSLKIGLQR